MESGYEPSSHVRERRKVSRLHVHSRLLARSRMTSHWKVPKGDVTTLNGPLLYEFANSNFVTIRVEKPGVGDSEGGPLRRPRLHYGT
jgi:hypothetical protein